MVGGGPWDFSVKWIPITNNIICMLPDCTMMIMNVSNLMYRIDVKLLKHTMVGSKTRRFSFRVLEALNFDLKINVG